MILTRRLLVTFPPARSPPSLASALTNARRSSPSPARARWIASSRGTPRARRGTRCSMAASARNGCGSRGRRLGCRHSSRSCRQRSAEVYALVHDVRDEGCWTSIFATPAKVISPLRCHRKTDRQRRRPLADEPVRRSFRGRGRLRGPGCIPAPSIIPRRWGLSSGRRRPSRWRVDIVDDPKVDGRALAMPRGRAEHRVAYPASHEPQQIGVHLAHMRYEQAVRSARINLQHRALDPSVVRRPVISIGADDSLSPCRIQARPSIRQHRPQIGRDRARPVASATGIGTSRIMRRPTASSAQKSPGVKKGSLLSSIHFGKSLDQACHSSARNIPSARRTDCLPSCSTNGVVGASRAIPRSAPCRAGRDNANLVRPLDMPTSTTSLQVQLLDHLGEVVGERVQIIAAAWNIRPAMSAPVERDAPGAAAAEIGA